MKAPLLDEDVHTTEGARRELALMAGDAGRRESRDFRVRYAPRLAHRVRHHTQAGAEHDRDTRHEAMQLPPHRVGRLIHCTFPLSRFPFPHHSTFSSSLCIRATSATRSYSGRNALSQAFRITRTSSSLPSPRAVWARWYSSVSVTPSTSRPSVLRVTTTPCSR